MKKSAKAIAVTGLAGAATLAGNTQTYADIVNFTLPSNIVGEADTTSDPNLRANNIRLYWNSATGVSTLDHTDPFSSQPAGTFEFTFYQKPGGNFFTGLAIRGGAPAAYYAPNGTTYVYPLGSGKDVVGTTGGTAGFYAPAGLAILSIGKYDGSAVYGFGVASGDKEYIGFQFPGTDGLLHDGWMEIESTVNSSSNPGGLDFLAGAYNTVPDASGGSIVVGELAPVPEPGTLAALAAGAAALTGIGLKRRRAARLARFAKAA